MIFTSADAEMQTGETCFRIPILSRTSLSVNHPGSKFPIYHVSTYLIVVPKPSSVLAKLSDTLTGIDTILSWHDVLSREGSVCIRAVEHCRFSPTCTPRGSWHWSYRFVVLFRICRMQLDLNFVRKFNSDLLILFLAQLWIPLQLRFEVMNFCQAWSRGPVVTCLQSEKWCMS